VSDWEIENLNFEQDGVGLDLVQDGTIHLEAAISFMQDIAQGQKVHTTVVRQLIELTSDLLDQLPNTVNITPTANSVITIVGDLHGNFSDLLEIFKLNGNPSKGNIYIFNGDFVDRGDRGLEILLVLMAFKVALPHHFHLNRGNHEDELIACAYSFHDECVRKQSEEIYILLCEMFAILPLAFLVKDTCFVVHGGLSRLAGVTIKDIDQIDRRKFVTTQDYEMPGTSQREWNLILDLLWSDPKLELSEWKLSPRGAGIEFGANMVQQFLHRIKVPVLVRSHELPNMKGFADNECGKGTRCITVFSASNYDGAGNHASILRFTFPKGMPSSYEMKSYYTPSDDVKSMAQRNERNITDLVVRNRHNLEKNFGAKAPDGSDFVSVGAWCEVLQASTRLQIRWDKLQPTLAPAHKGRINWKTFLDSFKVEAEGECAEDKLRGQSHLSQLYSNHRLLMTMFAHFDADQDGVLTKEDWQQGVDMVNSRLDKEDRLSGEELFKLMDIGGTGVINHNEFLESFRISNTTRGKDLTYSSSEIESFSPRASRDPREVRASRTSLSTSRVSSRDSSLKAAGSEVGIVADHMRDEAREMLEEQRSA